jgi:hypothetical protein
MKSYLSVIADEKIVGFVLNNISIATLNDFETLADCFFLNLE